MSENNKVGHAHPELEIIYGAERIARALGVDRRHVYHACAEHGLPHFRIGAVICARPAALGRWLRANEARSEQDQAARIAQASDNAGEGSP